jgi:hypothetical protein
MFLSSPVPVLPPLVAFYAPPAAAAGESISVMASLLGRFRISMFPARMGISVLHCINQKEGTADGMEGYVRWTTFKLLCFLPSAS